MNLDVVILAAGKGTRMRSHQAKVLHRLAGRSLLQHVVDTANVLKPDRTAIVVGHQAAEVQAAIGDQPVWVFQEQQLGTGHAVKLAMTQLSGEGTVLVLYGDVPLVSPETLQRCVAAADAGKVGLVTAHFADPAELGRIVRDEQDRIVRIAEFKDADQHERGIDEINSGIMAASAAHLRTWLGQLQTDNAQGEYYLTDIIAMAVADGVEVEGIVAASAAEVTGVNDRVQLAGLERIYQRRQAERLMREGVSIADPERLDIRGHVQAGQDCFLDINVILEGDVILGEGVHVGAGVVIADSQLGDGVQVHPHTVIDGAVIANNCSLGPFARIRPGSRLEDGVKIGNFVETKKAHLGAGSKASHLTYLGDVTLGADCNIGAGTVTCNYDGVNKHTTVIGDGVFVGTNTTLVAPIEIADNAFIAAGSTVTTKVANGELAVGRAKQRNIKGWVRPDQRAIPDKGKK
jgi:bifunctional UDP-N-acetylglucosamine pyrophosphorylase/glucosamine-1-phosphate N-acetyltransferase